MTPSLTDRYRGVVLGAACGDALGATLEFCSRGEVDRRYPDGLRDIVGGGWLRLAAGEVTDDTAMALCIVGGLTAGGMDRTRVAANFCDWAASGPPDIGNQTREVIHRLQSGEDWAVAGEKLQRRSTRGVAGNGSVMRTWPIALRFRRDTAGMRNAALDASRITHADPRATWGCVAVCQAIVHGLNGGTREGLIDAATASIDERRVVEAIREGASSTREAVRSGGFVLETLGAAFWALMATDSLEEAIVQAAALGDDADTTASVAGAIAGALYGAEALPQQWLDVLSLRDELEQIAVDLQATAEV